MKPSFLERQDLWKEYPNEVERMRQCLAAVGVTATADAAVRAWAEYWDDYCAGWLALPDDDATRRETLLKYLGDRGSSGVWRVTASKAAHGDDMLPICRLRWRRSSVGEPGMH